MGFLMEKVARVIDGMSIVNQLAFPGQSEPSSYDAHGNPFVGSRVQGSSTFESSLHWITDPITSGKPSPMLLVRREDVSFPTRFVVIHLHGNSEDIGDVCEVALAESKALLAHVLVPEYPGYGISPGRATADSIDAVARLAVITARNILGTPADRIVIFGRSLGTGPAAKVAAWMSETGAPPAAVALQSPFTSFSDLAKELIPVLGKSVSDWWNTRQNLKRCTSPVLLLHGTNDEVIPFEHSQHLLRECGGQQGCLCQLFEQTACTHNIFNDEDHVCAPLRDFLISHVIVAGGPCVICNFEALIASEVEAPHPREQHKSVLGGASAIMKGALACSGAVTRSVFGVSAASVAATTKALGHPIEENDLPKPAFTSESADIDSTVQSEFHKEYRFGSGDEPYAEDFIIESESIPSFMLLQTAQSRHLSVIAE